MKASPWHLLLVSFLWVLATACTGGESDSQSGTPEGTATTAPGPTLTLAASATPTARTPDLDQRPLFWFAPLPPMPTGPGRPFTGSVDFMDLFEPDAPWAEAAGRIQVFKLYGEWVAYHATDAELRTTVADIRRRGLALAVEAGPLSATGSCGQGVEGFAGLEEGRRIAARIRNAGGTIDLIALDEPYFFAHFYDGPNACRWQAEAIAAEVDGYVRGMQALIPGVRIGDTEPLAGAATAAAYQDWLDTFRAVAGYDLAFLHMDIDWSRPDWPAEVLSIEEFGRERGIPVGLIYTGNFQDSSDEAWLSIAGERVKRYELEAGGRPAHVLFQSWNDQPDHTLPETEPYTFTGFIRSYLEDRAALGFRTGGRGANLAFGKPARASALIEGYGPDRAVDGDAGTWWSAGDIAPQWIEIDLGEDYDVHEIRLVPSQSPAGDTVHRVLGRGAGTDGAFVLLHTFEGSTADSVVQHYAPAEAWQGLRTIRIETLESPSWIAWREIEIVAAGGG